MSMFPMHIPSLKCFSFRFLLLFLELQIATSEDQACYDIHVYDEILPYTSEEVDAIGSPSSWTRSPVSDQDDGCFDSVNLGFTFPWRPNGLESNGKSAQMEHFTSGHGRSNVVNPALGHALGATSRPLEHAVSEGTTITGGGDYSNLIAAFLTDLNPGLESLAGVPMNGTVQYASGPSALITRWSRVPLFFNHVPPSLSSTSSHSSSSSSPSLSLSLQSSSSSSSSTSPSSASPVSFEASLLANTGDVLLRFHDVVDPYQICCWTAGTTRREWSVGIRLPKYGNKAFSPTKYQAQWNTSVSGYYPPLSAIRSGVTVEMKRLSGGVRFCAYPSRILNGTTSLTLYLATGCAICTSCAYEAELSLGEVPRAGCNWDSQRRYLRCSFDLAGSQLAFVPGETATVTLIADSESLEHEPIRLDVVHANASTEEPFDPTVSVANQMLSRLCRRCFVNTSVVCPLDCSGEAGGLATVDTCGVCSGGLTGRVPDASKDCAGLCNGPYRFVSYPAGTTVHGSTGQCICNGGPEACLNKSLTFSPGTQEFHEMCASPNVTSDRAGTIVHISTGNHQAPCQSDTVCDVHCLLGNVSVAGKWSRANRSVRCPLPIPPPLPPGSTSQFIPILLKTHENKIWSSSSLLSIEVVGGSDPRFNLTEVKSLDDPHSVCLGCTKFHPNYCRKDCTGTYGGTAKVDDCLTCTGGTTNKRFNGEADCAGICNGPFQRLNGACYCPGTAEACQQEGYRSIYETPSTAANAPSVVRQTQITCLSPFILPQDGFNGKNHSYYLRIGTERKVCPKNGPCDVKCKIGNETVDGSFISKGNYVQCEPPPFPFGGIGNATVVVSLLVSGFIVPSKPLFVTYLPFNSSSASTASPSLLEKLANLSKVPALCDRCHRRTKNATCFHDCFGEWNGDALTDTCGDCTGGSTGLAVNYNADCQGVCNGPFEMSEGFCVCLHDENGRKNHSTCIRAGKQSIIGVQKQATLCVHPNILPTREPTKIMVMGSDLSNKPPPSPFGLVFGDSRFVPAKYDEAFRSLIVEAPPLASGSATLGVRVSSRGVQTGPWMFVTFDTRQQPPARELKDCGRCCRVNPVGCKVDCADVSFGKALVDSCGVCGGGTTGKVPDSDRDCLGICFGPYVVNASGVCECDRSNPMCTYYTRGDGDADGSATYEDLEGYYVTLVVVTSLIAGGVVAWVGWSW
eukprot:CAMPEP_0114521452 /NCGR_PEP_ID=MMETSP0109-20121206/20191_1 /TAXON_ID=29199 /ORGANISM="Chlorarachnion reptans, Strain CCCM449" /LENGTH=1191 /DNA_ID=CAMNT_0001702553 /DNA_START=327 /DNA_END=3899 /DNA_ORIENTATION=+